MAPCPTGHRQHCDCCWGTWERKAINCHSHPWEKDQCSPLLHWLAEHLPLGISPLPNTIPWITMPLGIQAVTYYPLRSLAAAPWLMSVTDPLCSQGRGRHSFHFMCCKDFNPIPVTASSDKSMQQSHEMRLILSCLQKGKTRKHLLSSLCTDSFLLISLLVVLQLFTALMRQSCCHVAWTGCKSWTCLVGILRF